jgi:hypothetical protein
MVMPMTANCQRHTVTIQVKDIQRHNYKNIYAEDSKMFMHAEDIQQHKHPS